MASILPNQTNKTISKKTGSFFISEYNFPYSLSWGWIPHKIIWIFPFKKYTWQSLTITTLFFLKVDLKETKYLSEIEYFFFFVFSFCCW